MAGYLYPPGHAQAEIDGCSCSVIDNARGRGCGYVDSNGRPLFAINEDCPLHAGAPALPADEQCFKAEDYAAAQQEVLQAALEERAK